MRALPLIAAAALCLAARAEADFGPEALIGPAAGNQHQPDIASDGKSFLIAWRNDASPGTPSIEVLRVEAGGTWAGSPAVLASPRRPTSAPAVAACGTGWVVAWSEPEGITVHVLDRAGASLHSFSEKARPLGFSEAVPRLGLACDGRGALIVWSEGQTELQALALPHGETAPRRLRLAADDPPANFGAVTVASDGDGFLVAWHSLFPVAVQGGNGTSSVLRQRIAALRVSSEGVVRDPRPFTVFVAGENGLPVNGLSVAAAGRGDYLVAWDRIDRQGSILAVRLRGSRPIDASPLKLGSGPSAWGMAAAPDPAGYLVAWTTPGPPPAPQGGFGRELRYARIPIQGPRLVESSLLVSESHAFAARLAAGAGGAIAAFVQGQPTQPGSAAGLDVWLKGLGGSPGATLVTSGPASQRTPALAGRGPESLLAWVDESTVPESIRTAAISPAGALAQPKGSVLARSLMPRQLSVSAGRSGYLVAWVAQGGVFAARVSPEGEPLDPAPLRLGDGAPNAAASFDGEAHVVAFSSGKEVLAVRVFEGGRAPEPAVRVGATTFGPTNVGNACERGSCLVTWSNNHTHFGLRVIHGRPEYQGTYARPLIESGGFADSLVVAAGGGRYVVAWGAHESGSGPRTIRWRNIDRLADFRDARAGELSGQRGILPAIAFDGRRFVAAWLEEGDPDPLRWSPVERGWLEPPRSLGVKGTSPALAATPGGGLTVAWVESAERAPSRVRLRTLAPHAEPPPPPPAPQLATFRLSELMARVRRSAATRAGERVDPEIDRQVRALVARIQATTLRGLLPVDPLALPGRGRPGSGQLQYSSPWGAEISSGGPHVTNAHYTGPGVVLGGVFGGMVVVDGMARIGSVTDSIVLATGDVDIAFVNRSIVVAGGRIEITGDGSMLEYGRGFASILVSGRRIDAGSCGGVLAAADGVATGNRVATVNVPAARIDGGPLETLGTAVYRDPGLVLSDAAQSPQLAAFEVALATSRTEARRNGVYLFRRGDQQPIAWGRESEPLRGLGGSLPPELEGYDVGFASPARVVLRSGSARADLVPSRPPRDPPPSPSFRLPPECEAHAVGVYLSTRADNVVEVDVDRPGVPILLLLSAYEAVRWRIRLSPGTRVVGAVLGGYHAPDGLEGLEPGTPVLTRVHDYGERPLYDYPGRTDPGPGVKELARELTDHDLASFQGAEKGERYRIGADAVRDR